MGLTYSFSLVHHHLGRRHGALRADMVLEEEPEIVDNGQYRYPALKFVRRRA